MSNCMQGGAAQIDFYVLFKSERVAQFGCGGGGKKGNLDNAQKKGGFWGILS